MSWLRTFLLNRLLQPVAKFLEGKKTLLGILLILVSVVGAMFPETLSYVTLVNDWLIQMGAPDLRSDGVVLVIVGLLDKARRAWLAKDK